jgi:hypothetical protein
MDDRTTARGETATGIVNTLAMIMPKRLTMRNQELAKLLILKV